MKFIGHVSCGVLATAPLIKYREHLPLWADVPDLSDAALLGWSAFFAVLPDIDILLQRHFGVKHRGPLTHSFWSSLVVFGAVAVVAVLSHLGHIPDKPFFSLFTAFLACLSFNMHLMGDSLTKTGIPLWGKKTWHFPWIGGKTVYDNYFLNAIPLFLAGLVLNRWFGIGEDFLRRNGHFKDFFKFLN